MASDKLPSRSHKPDLLVHGTPGDSIGNSGEKVVRSPFDGFKAFAVAGATGGLGAMVCEELSKVQGTKVFALSRQTEGILADGVHQKRIDYEDVDALAETLKGVEVVISTLNGEALGQAQPNLAKAAKQAKVQLFVPSEFGLPTHNLPKTSPLWVKTNFQNTLASLQIDYCVLYNYIFPDVVYQSAFGFDFLGGFVEIVGTGDVPIPQTSRRDVARFLSYILTALSPVLITNKRLVLEADRCTLNEAIDIYRDTHSDGKIFVQRITLEECKRVLAEKPDDLVQYLRAELAVLQPPEKDVLSNKLWPEWNPATVRDVIYAME